MNIIRSNTKVHPITISIVKVHASFSGSESGATCMQLAQMVAKASGTSRIVEFTGTHSAQPDKWFEVWKGKLNDAQIVVVIFSIIYRDIFTKALKKEALAILDRYENNLIKVYIFDPSIDSAADIRNNIEEDAPYMGDLTAWKKFVTETEPFQHKKQQQHEEDEQQKESNQPTKESVVEKKSIGENLKEAIENELNYIIEEKEDFELADKYQEYLNEINLKLIPIELDFTNAKKKRDFNLCTILKEQIKLFPKTFEAFEESKMTPQENTVKQLSKNNTINKPIDERGRTPLMQAAVDNDIPTMEYLLKYGAQVDLQTQYGNSALIFASMEGHSNAVEMLVNAKADVNLINNDGFNAVMQAARCGYVRVLKHLLHAGADVDVQDNEKETALIRAAKAGQVKTVKLLLENSANIDIHDSNDKSAYEWAKELNEKECVILFEEQEEERRRRGDLFNEKEASFIQAASDGDVSKLLAIIEEGININCQDKSGYSALILASMKGKDKVVKVLLDRHAEVDLTTKVLSLSSTLYSLYVCIMSVCVYVCVSIRVCTRVCVRFVIFEDFTLEI